MVDLLGFTLTAVAIASLLFAIAVVKAVTAEMRQRGTATLVTFPDTTAGPPPVAIRRRRAGTHRSRAA
jgi:hypothetical protein